MNEKIPLKRFAAGVASRSGMDAAEAEEFIKSLFATIANGLRTGEPVSVPGLGEFRLTHNPEDPVTFVPEAAWADEVNAPFAMFEPVELAEGITDTQLAEAEKTETETVTAASPSEEVPEQETDAEPATVVSQPLPQNQEPAPVQNQEPTPAHEPVSTPATTPYRWPEEEEEEAERLEAELAAKANETSTQPALTTTPPPFSSQPAPTTPTVTGANDSTTEPEEASSTAQEDDYYRSVRDSKSNNGFTRGFIIGLIVGLAIGALALCAYVLYYVNTPAGQLPLEVELDATEVVPAN